MEICEINELDLTPVVVRYEMFQDIPGEIYIPNVIRVRNNETPENCMKRLWSREFIELLKAAEESLNDGEEPVRKINTSVCWCTDIRAKITFDNDDYIEYYVGYLYER